MKTYKGLRKQWSKDCLSSNKHSKLARKLGKKWQGEKIAFNLLPLRQPFQGTLPQEEYRFFKNPIEFIKEGRSAEGVIEEFLATGSNLSNGFSLPLLRAEISHKTGFNRVSYRSSGFRRHEVLDVSYMAESEGLDYSIKDSIWSHYSGKLDSPLYQNEETQEFLNRTLSDPDPMMNKSPEYYFDTLSNYWFIPGNDKTENMLQDLKEYEYEMIEKHLTHEAHVATKKHLQKCYKENINKKKRLDESKPSIFYSPSE